MNAFATRACAHEGILDLAASAHRLAHEAKCAVLRLSQQEQRMRVGVGTGARESQMCETPRASARALAKLKVTRTQRKQWPEYSGHADSSSRACCRES